MRIASQSPTELVVKDSSAWISIVCASVALLLILVGIVKAAPNFFLTAALFLLFATVTARSMTFTFDGIQRIVRWSGYKPFKARSGVIAFDDITDIATEALPSDGATTYRLAILTAQGATPMAYAYTGRNDGYAALRMQLLEFIRPGLQQRPAHSSPYSAAETDDLQSSIRSLLKQGRKIDAVALLQSRQRMTLKGAVARIDAVDKELKTEAGRR